MISDLALQRLQQECEIGSEAIPDGLPILHFGQLHRAEVATVGYNPSGQEYFDRDRETGRITFHTRRFATLGSLKRTAIKRTALRMDQAQEALDLMNTYFERDPYWDWFREKENVLSGFGGPSYRDGTAAHLDLVQEPTISGWSKLGRLQKPLLVTDLPFLYHQIEATPKLHTLLTVYGRLEKVGSVPYELCRLLKAERLFRGNLSGVEVFVARAFVGNRSVRIAGWNRLNITGLHQQTFGSELQRVIASVNR